jgi:hypothetical protein
MLAAFLCAALAGVAAAAGEVVLSQVTPRQRIVYRDGERVWQRLVRIGEEARWLDESKWKKIEPDSSEKERT